MSNSLLYASMPIPCKDDRMVRVSFPFVQISGDNLIFPVEVSGDANTYITVLPQIVADRMFGRSGVNLVAHLKEASNAIAGAVERAWRPERLRKTIHNDGWAMRLWLNIEDFI